MDFDSMYIRKKIYMIAIMLILLGSINWLAIGTVGQDLVRLILPPRYAKWIYIVIGLSAIPLVLSRDIYLPFLGETLVPGAALEQRVPQNANDQITVTTKPGAKVLYWTTEPNPTQGKEIGSWREAYNTYENSGVAVADATGKALLRFRGPPQPYKVPMRFSALEPHIHFRICDGETGMMGRVQTMFLQSGAVEGFADLV
jgi:uncharacterized membrane protein YuzA (DUF378 family)